MFVAVGALVGEATNVVAVGVEVAVADTVGVSGVEVAVAAGRSVATTIVAVGVGVDVAVGDAICSVGSTTAVEIAEGVASRDLTRASSSLEQAATTPLPISPEAKTTAPISSLTLTPTSSRRMCTRLLWQYLEV